MLTCFQHSHSGRPNCVSIANICSKCQILVSVPKNERERVFCLQLPFVPLFNNEQREIHRLCWQYPSGPECTAAAKCWDFYNGERVRSQMNHHVHKLVWWWKAPCNMKRHPNKEQVQQTEKPSNVVRYLGGVEVRSDNLQMLSCWSLCITTVDTW